MEFEKGRQRDAHWQKWDVIGTMTVRPPRAQKKDQWLWVQLNGRAAHVHGALGSVLKPHKQTEKGIKLQEKDNSVSSAKCERSFLKKNSQIVDVEENEKNVLD